MFGLPARIAPRIWALIALIMAAGLALRVVAAGGGLWTDEAWSVIYAHRATPFWGVITEINHDNNHHLNSWWLQLVGMDAPSLVARGLSVLAGTLAIGVAALIGLRRGAVTGTIAALLFALSPMMVMLSAEARGYGLLMPIFLMMVLLVDRWLDDEALPPPVLWLSVLGAVGMLSHMMVLPGLAAIGVGAGLTLWQRIGFWPAFKTTADVFVRPALVLLVITGAIVGIAIARHGAVQVGSYEAFDGLRFLFGLNDLLALTFGIGPLATVSWVPATIGAMLLALAWITRTRVPFRRRALFGALILFLPLVVALLHPGNSHFQRYYMISSIGLLLLVADVTGALLIPGRLHRLMGAVAVAGIITGSAAHTGILIRSDRGNPDGPVRLLAALAPGGATLALDAERPQAVLGVAAAQAGYALRFDMRRCATAPYYFTERRHGSPVAQPAIRCGKHYQLIGRGDAIALSGQSWALYAQTPLPIPGAADIGATPKR